LIKRTNSKAADSSNNETVLSGATRDFEQFGMMVIETELGAKVYADSERALADIAKSVHFHDWLMNIELNATRNF